MIACRFLLRAPLLLAVLGGLALLLVPPLRADYYSSNNSYGYATLDSGFGGGGTTVRAGGTLTMTLSMGTYSGSSIDYGTGISCDQVVSGPWWLTTYTGGLQGNFGPESAVLRYIYRATDNPNNWWEGRVYFHITFYPSYAESNIGFFRVVVRGSWPTFSSLPSSIAPGQSFTATTLGQDDDGMLASVTTQVSMNGGAWSTLGSAGGGNGWSSTTPGTAITAGAAGTTYQFRAWTTDTNGYQSREITSSVYTVTAPPVSASISASPPTAVWPATGSTITWSSSNATTVTVTGSSASGFSTATTLNGSQAVTASAPGTHTYTITAQGPGGQAITSATFTVTSTDVYGNGSGYTLPGGQDLDAVFEDATKNNNAVRAADVGYKTLTGTDLSQRYFPLSAGGTAPASTGYTTASGADLSTIFAAKGTLQFQPNHVSGLVGWYDYTTWNNSTKVWSDKSGLGNHTNPSEVRGTPVSAYSAAGTAGNSIGFSVIGFDIYSGLRFPAGILPPTYTLFHVSRYTAQQGLGRIVTGISTNWLSGHWAGLSGMAYHEGWLTNTSYNHHGNNWVISSDQNSLYRSNGYNRTGSSAPNGSDRISVNHGLYGEYSDGQVAELIVYNRTLTLTEIQAVERYLGLKYGITVP